MNLREWLKDETNIYIGREYKKKGARKSVWANPFRIEDYGREGSIIKYREWIATQTDLLKRLPELAGKSLGVLVP